RRHLRSVGRAGGDDLDRAPVSGPAVHGALLHDRDHRRVGERGRGAHRGAGPGRGGELRGVHPGRRVPGGVRLRPAGRDPRLAALLARPGAPVPGMKLPSPRALAVPAAVFVFGLVAPALAPAYQTQMAFLWVMIVFALTWDLLGGQMGYNSFGNILFFGI